MTMSSQLVIGNAPMPCISLWQPWAQWLALGWKVIETRTHNRFSCLNGKRIGIHASQKWDCRALEMAKPWLNEFQISKTKDMKPQPGMICTAFVWKYRRLDVRDEPGALIECETDRYGLYLRDVESLVISGFNGKQGIFHLSPHSRNV